MKIVKKSLIIASTLALGLTLVGCNKKNVAINKNSIVKLADEKPVSSAQNQRNVRIKNGQYRIYENRFVAYKTSNEQLVIYDPITNKEIYSTSDEIDDINFSLGSSVLVISFDDGSETAVSTNGKTLVDKGYHSIDLRTIDVEKKNNKYYETTFYIATKKVGEQSVVKFYKMTKNLIKDKNGDLIEELNLDYKLDEISEKDILEYKKGDSYPKSNKRYTYSTNSSNVTFYDNNSKRAIVSINSTADYLKVILLKDKAIVQYLDKTTSEDNYDVTIGDEYYNYITYKVDLKKGTYKKVNDFKYLIFASGDPTEIYNSVDDEYPNYYFVKGAFLVKDKVLSDSVSICLDNNAKVVMKDQKYVYCDSDYYDLGNGNYITYDDVYDSVVYLTDKNGLVKKVFNGNAGVLYDSKVICIENNQELYLLDFKGNYITDKPIRFSGDLVFADQTHVYYTSQSDNKMRLLTLGDSKIVSDVEIEYKASISSSVTFSTTTINEEDRYYCDNNFYFTLEAADLNGDNIKDCYNIYYYSVNGNKIYQLDGIRNMSYHESTNIDGSTCYIALSTVYSTSTESELTISLFTK